jgi:hypothetical protein
MAKARRSRDEREAAQERIARSVVDVILGEAAFRATPDERLRDMQAIASVIMNRAQRLHVTPEDVVSNHRQFNAYGVKLPAGSEEYRRLAELALRDVRTVGPVNNATYYATPERVPHLLEEMPELQRVTQTVGHIYFDDPLNGRIVTAAGVKPLDPVPAFAPRTQTPMYDAGQIGSLRPGAEYAAVAQPPLAGSLATDRFVKGKSFWSDPAWQSYLFDFAEHGAIPPDAALPEYAPIPRPRPQPETAPIPQRRPGGLNPAGVLPGGLPPDPIDTRLTRNGRALRREASQFEVLAFGTNDFGEPRKAVKSFERAVANARARGRTPVAVMPNIGNPRIARVAKELRAAAERLGVETVTPNSWARDRIHPSAAEYQAIADQFDGAVVRGDSFAEGIIGAQETKSRLSFAKRGASSTTVLSAINRIDGPVSAAPAGMRGTLAGLGAFIEQATSPTGRAHGGPAASPVDADFLPDTALRPQLRSSLGMGELVPHGYGTANIDYAHPERGAWYEGLTPETIAHVEAMARMNPHSRLSITSAKRSKSQNRKAGGARRSQHLTGNAYDMDLSGLTDEQRAQRVAQARALGADRIGSYANHPDMLHVDFAKRYGNNAGGVYAMHNLSANNLSKAPGWMKAGLQADLSNVGRQAAATTLGMAGLLGLDGRPAGPAARRGVVPDNVGTSIPDSLRARGMGAAPISDFRAMPRAVAAAPFERDSFGRPGVVPDNVGTSIPDSLRASGMGAAPISDFRAMPRAAAAAPFERQSFAGMPGMRMAADYIGASAAAPFSPSGQAGLRLASRESTPGLAGFQPTSAKSGRYLKAQPDFAYANPSETLLREQAAIDPNWPGFIRAGDIAGPGTGLVAGQDPTLPQHALDAGLLGPSATLAQQDALAAAQLATFEPRRQPTVAASAPPLSAPRAIAPAPTIAAPAPDLRAVFPPAPPEPQESLFASIVGPRQRRCSAGPSAASRAPSPGPSSAGCRDCSAGSTTARWDRQAWPSASMPATG